MKKTKAKAKHTKKPAKRESPVVFVARDPIAKGFSPLESPNGTGTYAGYFENEHREKFVIEIFRNSRTGILRAIDGGSPPVRIEENAIIGDTVLSVLEFQWLSACWSAALGTKLMPQDAQPRMWEEANRQESI